MLRLIFFASILILHLTGCEGNSDDTSQSVIDEVIVNTKYRLPQIDLTHWKVTLPIGDPLEVKPPEILNYATNDVLKPFMYNDSIEGALVFYTYPGSTTANTSYSRTELREQIVPGSNEINWTFKQGGKMKGSLSVPEVSKDKNGVFHRTIIMQIHGRLTNSQRDLIGKKDNNAPPILKIYWQEGKIRVKSKVLTDLSLTGEELWKEDSWTDDAGYTFSEEVGHGKFNLEIIAGEGRLVVILNEKETWIKEDVSLQKWADFENYFKAGNYLQTLDVGSFARVKFYELSVIHS